MMRRQSKQEDGKKKPHEEKHSKENNKARELPKVRSFEDTPHPEQGYTPNLKSIPQFNNTVHSLRGRGSHCNGCLEGPSFVGQNCMLLPSPGRSAPFVPATKIYFTNCSAKLMCSQIAHQRTYQVEHVKPNQIIATLVIDFDLLDFRLPRLLSTFPSYSNSFNS
jgi:hypothetical protein